MIELDLLVRMSLKKKIILSLSLIDGFHAYIFF